MRIILFCLQYDVSQNNALRTFKAIELELVISLAAVCVDMSDAEAGSTNVMARSVRVISKADSRRVLIWFRTPD